MNAATRSLAVGAAAWLCVTLVATVRAERAQGPSGSSSNNARVDTSLFAPSSDCLACHNELVAPTGEDVSIGAGWRGTMMANSARDPYVVASVRRETIDHPARAADIEDECASCHMPAARQIARAAGQRTAFFSHASAFAAGSASDLDGLAVDGVSCTVCHQIAVDGLGTPQSFNGNFVVAPPLPDGTRRAFGPSDPDAGRKRIMHSVTGFQQQQAAHIRESELCATCHTLITEAFGPEGRVIGSLHEQMNYQEWKHSAFFGEQRGCQSCHMPKADGPVRIASVLGDYRESLSRHTFVGGNAFMLRMMNRYRSELGIEATSSELETTARATLRQLERDTATVAIDRAVQSGGVLSVDVLVRNMTGHKFPTGYPSRRAWLHVTVRDVQGGALFESGKLADSGLIDGNSSDADGGQFEPHFEEISRPEDVQIYESILGTSDGRPTTGLLQATRYLKDNRLLPRGFDKQTAGPEIGVVGTARGDEDFTGEGDRIRYRVAIGAPGPVTVDVELLYQSIGFRWARNLAEYDAPEPKRFVRYYDTLAAESSVVAARASRTIVP